MADLPYWLGYFALLYFESVAVFLLVALLISKLGPRLAPTRFLLTGNERPAREAWYTALNLTFWTLASLMLSFTNVIYGVPKMLDLYNSNFVKFLRYINFDLQIPRTSEVIYSLPWLYYPLWFFFMLLLADTIFYFLHRLLHTPTLYRFTHGSHHRFTSPTAWCAYSFHWFEGFLLAISTAFLPYLLFPMNPMIGLSFNFFALIWAAFLHSGFATTGWPENFFLRTVYSPSHHALHHSSGHGNYGLYFTFWDRVFGTELRPANER